MSLQKLHSRDGAKMTSHGLFINSTEGRKRLPHVTIQMIGFDEPNGRARYDIKRVTA